MLGLWAANGRLRSALRLRSWPRRDRRQRPLSIMSGSFHYAKMSAGVSIDDIGMKE